MFKFQHRQLANRKLKKEEIFDLRIKKLTEEFPVGCLIKSKKQVINGPEKHYIVKKFSRLHLVSTRIIAEVNNTISKEKICFFAENIIKV